MLQLEYWTRINNSLLCLVFIFLGYALGIQRGRGKSQNTAAICFFALAFYYGLFFAGIGLARSGWPPPILAVFLPTFIIFCMAFFLFQRLRWVG